MYTLHNTVKISDLRKKTAEVIEEIAKSPEPVYIFSRSEPKVVMMSWQVFENWQKKATDVKNAQSPKGSMRFTKT